MASAAPAWHTTAWLNTPQPLDLTQLRSFDHFANS